ncbi:MAG: hypothetical protein IJN93_01940 [Clostridia bacterium]|nr:hypothetical protein [Clostridia bacterium]
MTELLKIDLRRVLKDKLLIVVGILAATFALITPILYVVLFGSQDMMDDPMIANLITAKSQFFQNFSMGNNLGLIAPVLLAIVLCKDFSFGTVRNKIIAGKSRTSIYLSLFTVCSVTLIAAMLLSSFLTLGVSLIFFDYQPTDFTGSDFVYFLVSLALEILVLIFMAALLSWLCAVAKNVGTVIVLYVAISFGLVMIGSITQVVIGLFDMLGGSETVLKIVQFVDRINIGNFAVYIGMGTEYSVKDILYLTISPAFGILFFTTLGLLKFNKRDLK